MSPSGKVIVACLTIGGILLMWWALGPALGIGLALVMRGLAEIAWMLVWRRKTKAERQLLQDLILKSVVSATEETTKKAVTEYLQAVLKTQHQIITFPPDTGKGH